MIVRKGMVQEGRNNLCDDHEFLQCATLRMDKGQTFRAHQHKWYQPGPHLRIPQESWVVITGLVKVFFYDTDGTLLHEDILSPGDASFTFEGGHNYEVMADNTFVYEYKTGPYLGQENDKVFL